MFIKLQIDLLVGESGLVQNFYLIAQPLYRQIACPLSVVPFPTAGDVSP